MACIENIYEGNNISIEEVDENSVRIHLNEEVRDIERVLVEYMSVYDYIPNGDTAIQYNYFAFNNCIVRVNGKYIELSDFLLNLSVDEVIYDIYLKIDIYGMKEDSFEMETIYSYYYTAREENIFYEPPGFNYYHLFRVVNHGSFIEHLRMIPPLLDINCCDNGFVAYHNYQFLLIRDAFTRQAYNQYALPVYSETGGPMLIFTPFIRQVNDDPEMRTLTYCNGTTIYDAPYES